MTYMMAGQLSELERLRLQSRVWEPTGDRLLARLSGGQGRRVLEVGCGAMGWLRILSRWAEHLRSLLAEVFARSGGDFNAGRRLPEYLRAVGIDPCIHCECIALEPGHPYIRLPVQFATSLRPRLLQLVDEDELDRLMEAARMELADPRRWGMTFTLVQAWGRAT